MNDLLHCGQLYLTPLWIRLWRNRLLLLANVFGHKSQDICSAIFNFCVHLRLAISSYCCNQWPQWPLSLLHRWTGGKVKNQNFQKMQFVGCLLVEDVLWRWLWWLCTIAQPQAYSFASSPMMGKLIVPMKSKMMFLKNKIHSFPVARLSSTLLVVLWAKFIREWRGDLRNFTT